MKWQLAGFYKKKKETFIKVLLNRKNFEDLTNFIRLRFWKVKINFSDGVQLITEVKLRKIFKTKSMWKLNFKGYKNKKKLSKISKDFCAKFLNKSVILKIIVDLYWKKSRIFTCAELCRFPEKSNKKNAAIW